MGESGHADFTTLEQALVAQGQTFLQARLVQRDNNVRRSFYHPNLDGGESCKKGKKGKSKSNAKGAMSDIAGFVCVCFWCGSDHLSAECYCFIQEQGKKANRDNAEMVSGTKIPRREQSFRDRPRCDSPLTDIL